MHENDTQRMRLDSLVAVFRQRHTPDICLQEMETINLCIANGVFSKIFVVVVFLNSIEQI